MDCFVDSGSPISVISPLFASALNSHPEPSSSIPALGIGGQTRSVGRITSRVTIGHTSLLTELHVFEHATDDMFIGNLDAARFGLEIDFETKVVRQKTQQIPTINIVSKDGILDSLDDRPVFARSSLDVGRITVAKHTISVKADQTPIYDRPYRYSNIKHDEIERQVAELLTAGLIRPSDSPWASPVTLTPKKDDTKRFCCDFRKLNAVTSSYRHPLPLIQDLLDRVGNSHVFSLLDAVCGYWHVALDEESIAKSAFVTQSGHYEWLVMPFGLKNAPATFQRIMQIVLREFIGRGVEVYLDDIIVHTADEESHALLLNRVLATIEQAGIRLKRKKCSFFETTIAYLGHVISNGEVRPDPAKTDAVKAYPAPTCTREMQQFVGLANYYRDFVPDMSRVVIPLTRLTRNNVDFVWTDAQQIAFDSVKRILTSAPVLAVYDPELPNEISTDASKDGLAAVYTQRHADDLSKVVFYWSRATKDAETRYSAIELECLAVVEALERFRVYVEGTTVTLTTDCSALRWLASFKDTSSRLFRWAMRLSTFSFDVRHRAGRLNAVADALSRNPVKVNFVTTEPFDHTRLIDRQHELTSYQIRAPTSVINGMMHAKIRGRNRILVPSSLIIDILRSHHDDRNHPGTSVTNQIVSMRYWWPTLVTDVTDYVRSCYTCQTVKYPNSPSIGCCQPIEASEEPNDIWSIDTVVIGNAANGTAAKNALCVVDHHSRFCWTFPTKTNTTEVAIASLASLFNAVGIPRVLITDNGKNYTSRKFEEFLKSKNIDHRRTSVYPPPIERDERKDASHGHSRHKHAAGGRSGTTALVLTRSGCDSLV